MKLQSKLSPDALHSRLSDCTRPDNLDSRNDFTPHTIPMLAWKDEDRFRLTSVMFRPNSQSVKTFGANLILDARIDEDENGSLIRGNFPATRLAYIVSLPILLLGILMLPHGGALFIPLAVFFFVLIRYQNKIFFRRQYDELLSFLRDKIVE